MTTTTSPLTTITTPLTHEQITDPVELSQTCAHRVQDYIEHNGFAHLVPPKTGEIDHTEHIEHNGHTFDIRLQALSADNACVFISVHAQGATPSALTYTVMANTPQD